jgi:hypothetical protein
VPDYLFTAKSEGSFWQKHSLSIALISIMTIQTALSLIFGYQVWLGDQENWGLPTSDTGQFFIWWTYEYQTSLVADVFGAILLVLLTKRLRESGSAEDKGNQ